MQVTKHDPGTFCYIELATPDRKGAAKFYESLFGWKMKETPLPDGSTYVGTRSVRISRKTGKEI